MCQKTPTLNKSASGLGSGQRSSKSKDGTSDPARDLLPHVQAVPRSRPVV